MTNTQFTYQKNELTKWLLTITLFFSTLTFSGYAGNAQSRQQPTQTELVISNNYTTCKRTISYKKAFGLTRINDFLTNPCKNRANTLFVCNQLTKVKLDNISKQYLSHKFVCNFLHIKSVPQSSDEDIIVTSL